MKNWAILAATISGMVCAVASKAQDVSAGEKLYQKNCRTCHGPKAQGLASFPKLAGNSAEYLVGRLEQYRSGEKVGPNSPLMMPQAANLSDEDIRNIANYISTAFE